MNLNQWNLPYDYFIRWLKKRLQERDIEDWNGNTIGSTSNTFRDINLEFYYSDEHKHLSDFINYKMMSGWNSKTPIFISAQTGAGKNYFIQHTLLETLENNNSQAKDQILILSNRIALNRQSKKQFAERIFELTGYNYIDEMENLYTPKGIDKFCIDFGVVTICSYHQFYERHLLDRKHFKYIICDECHFFTSDSIFNPHTNNILQEVVNKGQDSIRIYMSATLDVAFEAILRTEFSIIENKRNEIEDSYDKEISSILTKMERYNAEIIINNNKIRDPQTGQYFVRNEDLQRKRNVSEYNFDVQKKLNVANIFLNVKFYYLSRDYSYIENIYSFDEYSSLVEKIKKSNNKWLFFSNFEGEKIKKMLAEVGSEFIFISRERINSSDEVNDEYNYIIDNETFRPKILISTSVLDNGINIKNDGRNSSDKVLNIVIDSFDRTEFIQMLGRIRRNSKDKINLYIKKYSVDDLKKLLKNDVKSLLQRLHNDLLDKRAKQQIFDKNLFYYVDDPDIFSNYNPCAIYQLIDRIARILNIIRRIEPNFYIDFDNREIQSIKVRIYKLYGDGQFNSYSWAKSVFDILLTYEELCYLEGIPSNFIGYTISPESRFDNSLKYSFTNYIFEDMIPKFLFDKLQAYFDDYFNILNDREKKLYEKTVKQKLISDNIRELSLRDKFNVVYPILERSDYFITKHLRVDSDSIYEIFDKIEYYRNLVNNDVNDPIEEQLKWIEKVPDDLDCVVLEEKIDTEDEFILKHCVSDYELNLNKTSENVKSDFLKKYGILKEKNQEFPLFKNFFDNKSGSQLLKESFSKFIEGKEYFLQSFRTNDRNHDTYYLFVFNREE